MRKKVTVILLLLQLLSSFALAQSQPATPVKTTAQQIRSEVTQAFEQENFAALETLATQMRAGKERLADGEWKLYLLYQALTWPPVGERASYAEWEVHLNKLRKWSKQASHSLTARVALASALTQYAWRAHIDGQDWHGIAQESGGRLFQERLKQAEKALTDGKKTATKCPHWYLVLLSIGFGQQWGWSQYNNVFAEAIALEPSYSYFYKAKAFKLLPRNQGGKGEWPRFAEETAQRLGGAEGALTYYLIVSHIRPDYNEQLLQENQLSWVRLKEGFEALQQSYGLSNARYNEMAWLAGLAKDQAIAQSCFAKVGVNWEPAVWKSKAIFDARRAWAYALPAANHSLQAPATPPTTAPITAPTTPPTTGTAKRKSSKRP